METNFEKPHLHNYALDISRQIKSNALGGESVRLDTATIAASDRSFSLGLHYGTWIATVLSAIGAYYGITSIIDTGINPINGSVAAISAVGLLWSLIYNIYS